ncbi:hypothetical protein D3C84_1101590 [compost metagenome]
MGDSQWVEVFCADPCRHYGTLWVVVQAGALGNETGPQQWYETSRRCVVDNQRDAFGYRRGHVRSLLAGRGQR